MSTFVEPRAYGREIFNHHSCLACAEVFSRMLRDAAM